MLYFKPLITKQFLSLYQLASFLRLGSRPCHHQMFGSKHCHQQLLNQLEDKFLYSDSTCNIRACDDAMADMLRLNSKEKELLRNKAVELNKKLIAKKCEPVKDTELAHLILEQAIELAEVSESGKVIILK